MPAPTPFEEHLGTLQGRIEPGNHTSLAEDNPKPAVAVSVAGPFVLDDGDALLVEAGDAGVQRFVFETAVFADPFAVTAAELAAVINASAVDFTAAAQGEALALSTDAIGTDASIRVYGGRSNFKLRFPPERLYGSQGFWTLVLGSDIPNPARLRDGDLVQASQLVVPNDSKIVRLIGLVRWAEPLPGFTWDIELIAGSETAVFTDQAQFAATIGATYTTSVESLSDLAVSLVGLTSPTTIRIRLRFRATTGTTTEAVTARLPGVFVDAVEYPEDSPPLILANRYPPPGQTEVDHGLPLVSLDLFDPLGGGVDLAQTTITIAGTVVFSAGVSAPGFSVVTTNVSATGTDYRFFIPLTGTSLSTWSSDQPVPVEVQSASVAGAAFSEIYTFSMADTQPPAVISAQTVDARTIRVTFDDEMSLDDPVTGIAVPGNYVITPTTTPAVGLAVVDATVVNARQVDLVVTVNELNDQGELGFATHAMSPLASYELIVGSNIQDDAGNPMDVNQSTVTFEGFSPLVAGRSFEHWEFLPNINRNEDKTQDLRKFSLVFQDIINIFQGEIDRWCQILDVDVAPEAFVDAMLCDLGNPFTFVDLTENQKRRLARNLFEIYRTKGTADGIRNAISFLTGVPVDLRIVNLAENFWRIGFNKLGQTTRIGPSPNDAAWYTFYILSSTELDDRTRRQIFQIADYMKVAHEHIGGIFEPQEFVVRSDFWRVGKSRLGVETIVSA